MEKVTYKNLAAEMVRNGFTQVDLANKLGLTKTALHNRLYGSVKWQIQEIRLLLKIFNKDFDYLFKEN